ncbi:MAG: NUDIX domain-containing protein [Patescibacteria group bacterium]
MQEELFDACDEQGNPKGERVTRADAHTKGIWHHTVHLYLVRKVGDDFAFLMHLRAKTKDLNPDKWDTRFGGHVLAGMSIADTARRELKEEVGLNLEYYKIVEGVVTKRDNFPNREFTHTFFVEVPEDVPVQLEDGEVQRVEWMTAKEIIASMQTKSRPWAGSLQGFQETLKVLQERWKG